MVEGNSNAVQPHGVAAGRGAERLTDTGVATGLGPQVQVWMRQIRKEQANGHDLDAAAREARQAFEAMLGLPLDAQQTVHWQTAVEEIRRSIEAPIEFLQPHSLRKPRRPDWYRGPDASNIHWPSLQAHLLERRRWSADTVATIDATSTEVVRLIEDPGQATFSGRGLVVGYVQSGKTANMLAVIAKAVDAGYRFVIILAGLTNSLRRQTQGRFEADLRNRNPDAWHLHTSYQDDGDFRELPNGWFSAMDLAQVAIVKKNVTPLTHLLEALQKTPERLRRRMPVLIIDDECDQASVNASGSQFDPSAINALVRAILGELPCAQYVGYTATPFANVLINPYTPQGQLDDLYPEDFITALPLPLGYFGTETLFGRDPLDADDELPEERGLDVVREVPLPDVASVQPPSARDRLTFEPSIPDSLERALRYFVLATAARHARGQQREHCSMLIHTTVYTATHQRLADSVTMWLKHFRAGLGGSALERKLADLWAEEGAKGSPARFGLTAVPWEEVRRHVPEVVQDIAIVVENSASDARLDFDTPARKYIVIGGSVLARGLTIEGLVVSYFVRTSSQYDTLLQMGRWFGYRPGYEDLPRLWMTADLSAAFRDLAAVENEIRRDIAEYVRRDQTPLEFAVRIRQIPGMAITAAAKMMNADACDVSFSGEHLQTIRFQHRDAGRLNSNWDAGSALVEAALVDATPDSTRGARLLRGVPLPPVLAFLRSYRASDRDPLGKDLLEYIRAEHAADARVFAHWNLAVVEPLKGAPSDRALGSLGPVRQVNRSRLSLPRRDGAADIKALMSKRDVLLDVDNVSADGDWEALKASRQASIGPYTPLLALYAIDPASTPQSDTGYRAPLDAVGPVLGVAIVIPDRGDRRSFVRVRLDTDAADGEDLLADLEDGA
jgi:hypothetical protein